MRSEGGKVNPAEVIKAILSGKVFLGKRPQTAEPTADDPIEGFAQQPPPEFLQQIANGENPLGENDES